MICSIELNWVMIMICSSELDWVMIDVWNYLSVIVVD